MKPLSEQTHYEILEIDRDARPEDVERAYRLAQATYGEESLATYSLLGEADAQALRERLEMAYEVLSDATARQHYDRTLGESEAGEDGYGGPWASEADELAPFPAPREVRGPDGGPDGDSHGRTDPLARPRAERSSAPESGQRRELRRFEGFDDEDEPEGAPWDGARLRRARLARGAELEAVADITKIGASYLRFLEEERFDALPASVYVRGFVAAYARCLGLDATAVATSYMERVDAARVEGPAERRRPRRAAWR